MRLIKQLLAKRYIIVREGQPSDNSKTGWPEDYNEIQLSTISVKQQNKIPSRQTKKTDHVQATAPLPPPPVKKKTPNSTNIHIRKRINS